jgi:hypothetical protein
MEKQESGMREGMPLCNTSALIRAMLNVSLAGAQKVRRILGFS